MEIHQLRYFCAVADTGSFTRAAEREKIAQPSLSQQIIKLEEELGVRLFDRLGRAARVTEAGRTFLTRARRILKEVKDAGEELSAKQHSRAGPIAVGVNPSIAGFFVPSQLVDFCAQYPQAAITIFEDASPRLLEHLRSGLLDIAIVALPTGNEDLKFVPLSTERLFAVLPSNHNLSTKQRLLWCDLNNEPFLLLRDHQRSRNGTIELWGHRRIVPRIILEGGQLSSVLAMVRAGLGITIVPELAIEPRDDCKFVPIADEAATQTIGMVLLKEHFLTGVQRAFVDHLKTWKKNKP